MLNRWQRTIVDLRGNVVPYAVVTVRRESDQGVATVYRDRAGAETYPNGQVTANQNGYLFFYARADLYRITATVPDIDWRDVDIGAAAAQKIAQQALDNALPTYETLVELQSDVNQPTGTMARVINDPDPDDNGYYLWDGSDWDRTSLQPADLTDIEAVQQALDAHKSSGDHDTRYTRRDQNLADLDDAATARDNLGLGSAATKDTSAFATATQGETADSAVQPTRKVTGSGGLTGGGDLSEDRTIDLTQEAKDSLDKADSALQPGDTSLTPAPGKIPVADSRGRIDRTWLAATNDIGIPGTQGFGVGVCPFLPDGYSEMSGTSDPASPNYGNYVHDSGAIEVWIPAHFFKWSAGNQIDIQPIHAFPSVSAANDLGYALDRTFIDGGELQPGIFIDKFQCSNSGGVAVSKPLQPPLSSHSTHNPFSELDGAPANAYWGAFAAAKTRSPDHFPVPLYARAMLARLSLAHGQAATSDTFCAWYDSGGIKNYPKGNNAALSDVDDATVTFTSDGFDSGGSSMPALTGSGSNFAKTTHNGQDCGIADVNGNMYDITPGLTCLVRSKAITGISLGNPVQLTVVGHEVDTRSIAWVTGIDGTTELNSKMYWVTAIDADTLELVGVDGTALTPYVSGGTITFGQHYTTRTSWRFAAYQGGTAKANDHWSAQGIAETMYPIDLPMVTAYPNNGADQRMGNADNQVFEMDVSGPGWARACLGIPAEGGASVSGSNQFGRDYAYQNGLPNLLCPISGAGWNRGALAGAWAVLLSNSRSSTNTGVGFRAASYPVAPSGSDGAGEP